MRVAPAAFAALVASAAAAGPHAGTLEIELNRLEPVEAGCQAYLVIRNAAATGHESLRLDIVAFDADGVIARRMAVEAGPVPAGKTSVRAFVAEGVSCDATGGFLLNDVLACGFATGCLEAARVAARPPLRFTK